jgi:uncharacterized membrane protein
MVVLSALIHLPWKIVFALGLTIVVCHNIFDLYRIEPGQPGYAVWTLLRQAGPIQIAEGKTLLVAYPLLPWLGIMLSGYGIGTWYTKHFNADKRYYLLLYAGAAATLLFIILRAINYYGDPALWAVQKNFLFTIMSFLNTTKYPPSLLYTLMTLGPVLIILALMEVVHFNALNPFVVIGRVPLFYYILHFYLIHTAGLITNMILSGRGFSEIDLHFNAGFGGILAGVGLPLWGVYIAWALIVLSLYPLCKWYNHYKSTHSSWWLSYL